MSLFCLAGLHAVAADPAWNAGYFVSRCTRCGHDLIRPLQGEWKQVPKGHRIVWRPKPADYPDWRNIPGPAAPEPADICASAPVAREEVPAQDTKLRLVTSAPAGPVTEANPPTFREWKQMSVERRSG